MTALFVVVTIILFLTIDYFVQKKESPAGEKWPLLSMPLQPLEVSAQKTIPAGAFVHPGHTWITIRENGLVRVGIDNFATQVLGECEDILFPAPEKEISEGEPLVSLRVDGRQAKFISPVDGKVMAVNEEVSAEKLPGEWLVEIKPKNLARQLRKMRIAESANKWLQREKARFRDFLASKAGNPALVLQDGGEPVPGLLLKLDDKAWSEFQREFLLLR